MAFLSLQEFHNHKTLPGEAIPLYLFAFKQLLGQPMAGLAKESCDQLLIHQFSVHRITEVHEPTVTSYR